MSGEQQLRTQRDALYVLIQRTVGWLDALDPFGDGEPVSWQKVNEVRRLLASATDEILPPRQAIVEEVTDPSVLERGVP